MAAGSKAVKFELYRLQALEFARSRIAGEVALAMPLNLRITS